MERTHLDFERYFEVVMETDEAQAAEMTVDPGRTVGGPENYHEASDQWLFVVSGTGVATVDGEAERIAAGDLLRIDAGERHGIENDGDEPLETVNFYTPPR
ncbi:cupin domain-containing protein [Haloarcula onubensis]|uniref:Cupin domain-containing protein n=1 Tax=Haloarcula onubensis TaxID=2950539 RepID=A0ABU2FMG0_9EURY|nr:cupin domain-containing protein [Halomicroarcula sp. S3CR25-11]MDS0281933.1 cupin domain-containing protein [Halomicroarcula sp. S3CR25-11]